MDTITTRSIPSRMTHWFWSFIIYSFIGWVYEVIVCAWELHMGFVNRGFLFGPYLPVYGCGEVIILLLLTRLKNKKLSLGGIPVSPLLCFVGILLLATSVELLTSYLMEWITGGWLWDYTDYGPNFQGRIALRSSLRFGIMGMAGLYLIQPVLDRFHKALRGKALYYIVTLFMAAVFLIDLAVKVKHL